MIPNYITASTPSGLRRLMLDNNKKKKAYFNYFSISFYNNKWVAWYYENIQDALKNEKQKIEKINE